jgi:hypothetical protein
MLFKLPAYAIVIGITRYLHGQDPDDGKALDEKNFRNLKIAAKDAKDFSSFLEGHGFAPDNVKLLSDEEATIRNIKDAFKELSDSCKDPDVVNPLIIVYFSGHGMAEDEELHYLVPYEAERDHLSSTAIPNDEFDGLLKRLRTNRLVVFLDACHSGGMVGLERKGAREGATIPQYDSRGLGGGGGRIVIASCKRGEESYESGENGIFTGKLLSLLSGNHPYFSDKEEIGVFDLYERLRVEVLAAAQREYKKHQEPQINEAKEATGIVLAINQRAIQSRIEQAEQRDEMKKRQAFLNAMLRQLENISSRGQTSTIASKLRSYVNNNERKPGHDLFYKIFEEHLALWILDDSRVVEDCCECLIDEHRAIFRTGFQLQPGLASETVTKAIAENGGTVKLGPQPITEEIEQRRTKPTLWLFVWIGVGVIFISFIVFLLAKILGSNLPAPKELSVVGATTTSLIVSWSPVIGADSYTVYQDTAIDGSFNTEVYTGFNTHFTDTGLASNTTYYYKARTNGSSGSSAPSAPVSGTTGSFYFAGRVTSGFGETPCYWKGGSLNLLPVNPRDSNGSADAIALDGAGDLYLAGGVTTESLTPCYWKNGALYFLQMGSGNWVGFVRAITLDGTGNLYLAGETGTSESSEPCYWKNGSLNLLPMGAGNSFGIVYAVALDGTGNLYLAGETGTSESSTEACYWKNGSLKLLPLNTSDSSGTANAIALDRAGNLYLAGQTAPLPCYWKNGSLNLLPMGAGNSFGAVWAIAIDGAGNLYLAGEAGTSTSTKPYYWKNGSLNLLPMRAGNSFGAVWAMALDGAENLYLAGETGTSESSAQPCYWENGSLNVLPMGAGSTGLGLAVVEQPYINLLGHQVPAAESTPPSPLHWWDKSSR